MHNVASIIVCVCVCDNRCNDDGKTAAAVAMMVISSNDCIVFSNVNPTNFILYALYVNFDRNDYGIR